MQPETRTRPSHRKVNTAQPIAMVASVAVFALMYANNRGTTASSTDACVVGVIIYWGLTPGWASRFRDTTALIDWAIGYFIVALVVLLAASIVTGWIATWMRSVPPGDGGRIMAVTGSFALVLAALVSARVVWSRRPSSDLLDRESQN